MASLSLYAQFETNLMSNRNVIELLLQLKRAKADGKNYIKVRPPLVRHPLRNRLLVIIWVIFTKHMTYLYQVCHSQLLYFLF